MASASRSVRRDGRAGLAALEFALVLPILLTMLFLLVDLGRAFAEQFQIVTAVANGASYATNAYQTGTSAATVASKTQSVVVAISNSLLASNNVTVSINNGTSASNKCCLTTPTGGTVAWSCSNPAPTCADGSNPGVYMSISASVPFVPFFAADTTLTGKTLSSAIIQRLQ